jgi:outer membrane protein OmpA-like peptidoglycan-associated protein
LTVVPIARAVLAACTASALAGCAGAPSQTEALEVAAPQTPAPAPIAAPPETRVSVRTPLPDIVPEAAPAPLPERIEVRAGPPERVQPPRLPYDELFVLLPSGDAAVGGLVVRHGEGEIVLDRAHAAARVRGAGQTMVFEIEPAQARRVFAAAIAALPPAPSRFVVHFETGSDRLDRESVRKIEQVFAELATRPAPEIVVVGHTDTTGSAAFNDRLSLQRAQTVRNELIRRGIDAATVSAAGRGQRELLIPTADDVAEPRNRRVEIFVR